MAKGEGVTLLPDFPGFGELVILHQEPDQLHIEIHCPFFVLGAKGPEIGVVALQHGAGVGFKALIVNGNQLINVLNEDRIGWLSVYHR